MILPAVARYLGELSSASAASRGVNQICEKVAGLADGLVDAVNALEHAQHEAHETSSVEAEARAFVDHVIPAQGALREVADELETLVSDELWPLPKYRELLFAY
jgi:glutamine synthetase